ncbi:hypothetical protein D3C76_879580 [compost metagenome]
MIEPAVEGQGEFVGRVTEKRQPAMVTGDHIELVAVYHQQVPAVGGDVHGFVDQLDVAQDQLRIAAQEFVVVAGDVDHLGATLAHGQQAADDVGVRLRPVHAAAQFPAVDDVADQVDLVRVITLEELRQMLGLAIAGAQMHIGNPQGPHTLLTTGFGELGAGHGQPSGQVLASLPRPG